jgi:hypothetical protein
LTEALKGLVMRFKAEFEIEDPDRRLLFDVSVVYSAYKDAPGDVTIDIEECDVLGVHVQIPYLSYSTIRRLAIGDKWMWFSVALPTDDSLRADISRRFKDDYEAELNDAIDNHLANIE